jgi:2-dehydro-3-deoxygluconokinase
MPFTRLVTFGEAMLRLTTPAEVPLESTTSFRAPVGGAELNAAIAAVRSGMEASWVSTLPAGPLGDLVARHCRAGGVTPVVRRVPGARLGLYFLEQATPPRASRIVYDREASAFARHPSPELAWADLLDADTCLLVTGITPALGPEARRAVDDAISSARAAGAAVAVDVNYRASLWSPGEAHAWLSGVVERVDVLSASREELAGLGVEGDDAYRAAVERLGLRAAVGTSKELEGRRARIRVTAAAEAATSSVEVEAEVVDPVGAGDAVFGTFLACLDRHPLDQAVERAAGAAVTSYGLFGDALTADPWDLDEDGRVRR